SSGDFIASNSENYSFALTDDVTISAHFIPSSYTADSNMVGYATITADDANAKYTITGGYGGNTISINSLSDLTSNATILSGDEPYIVKFTNADRITTTDNVSIIMSVGSNKTVYGAVTGAGLKNIEMRVQGQNVIIRNLVLGEVIAYDTYGGKGNDALSLNGARHVWVDHCELRSNTTPKDNTTGAIITNSSDSDFAKDFYDGLLDIKNGATWITISNCYIHDHYKACLCGSGDDGPDTNSDGYSDSDMRVTFANNYWKNINARQPLFRWGKAHIYGSYFDAGTFSGGASFINCRAGSELYIEGNTFTGTKSDSYTIGYYYDTTGNSGSWVSKNNSGVSSKNGTSYTPAYGVTNVSAPSSAPTDKGATLTLSY
uniref:pectate lyase family protein n=1 Tax=Treponema sp. TaxID=166 RepID=UPI00388E6BB9